MALQEDNVAHIGLSVLHGERLWIRWIDLDGKKFPLPEIGSAYYRFDELPPLERGKSGGIGLVLEGLSDGRSVGGIDLDGCLVDGVLLPWAQAIVDEVGSYTEISPSGTGVKIFFTLEEKARATKLYRKHVQWPKHGGQAKAWGIECYISGGRFFTVTGKVYQNFRVVETVSTAKLKRINEHMVAFDGAAKAQKNVRKAISFMKNDDLSWEEWNTRGMAIFNATWGSPAGRDAWVGFSKLSEKFTEKETLGRWGHWPTSPGEYVGAKQVIGWARENGYEPEDDVADELGCRRQVEELNQRWATIRLGKKLYILDDTPQEGQIYSIMEIDPWRRMMSGFSVRFGKRDVPLHEVWLESRYRRQYRGIMLSPQGAPEGYYNLWRGWAVEPRQGSWELFKRHLYYVVCSGEPTNWRYLRRWLAYKLQNPGKKLGVAVALKGGKGAGKSIVADYLMRVFGVHSVRVTHERHFLGNFNVHLEHALLVNAEEAFWAGNKKADGVMKDLITGNSMMIERKGIDTCAARNLLDVLVTSNADWVVPASHDERRYFVLEVSDEMVGNFAYFRALATEMEGTGPSAMLFDLLSEDLSGFEPRDVPATEALLEQKIEGMKSEEWFFYEIAKDGHMPGLGLDGSIGRKRLYQDYLQFCSEKRLPYPVKDSVFGKLVASLGVGRAKLGSDGSRAPVYRVPSLVQFRAAFDAYMGQETQWQDVDDETVHEWRTVDGGSWGNIDF